MLDSTDSTSNLEELSFKVYGRSIRLVGVSQTILVHMHEGFIPIFSFIWGISGPFFGVYVVVQNLNIPLIIQPHVFALFCAVSWTQVTGSPT